MFKNDFASIMVTINSAWSFTKINIFERIGESKVSITTHGYCAQEELQFRAKL